MRGIATVVALGAFTFSGCAMFRVPRIKVPGIEVQAPKDAGKPASLNTSDAKETLTIPPGSRFILKQKEALPATSERPAQPAESVVEIEPSAAMQWAKAVNSISADTGTVDTSVALARVKSDERKPLLYMAIIATLVGLGLMYFRFPSLAVMAFIGAGLFGLAWWFDRISGWTGGLCLCCALAGVVYYNRGALDKNGDGTLDILQRKP